MSRPWMPWYVADFVADTLHLSAAQTGAYMLLIGHYWQHGGLPDDDQALARVARMGAAEWRKSRGAIAEFFHDGWKHKRIDAELARAADISSKRAASAKQKHSNSSANAEQLDTHARASSPSQPPTDSGPRGPAAGAAPVDVDVVDEDPKARLFRIGKTTLISFGITEKRTGALIGQWLKSKNDPIGLLAAIQFARDHNVAEPVAYISTLMSGNGQKNGHGKQALGDLALDLADQLREQERACGIGRPPAA